MQHFVLGIGYSRSEYDTKKKIWREYGVALEFADDVSHAVRRLANKEYACVVICSDTVSAQVLNKLREVQPIPILVVQPSCNTAQRYTCVHFGAMQYLNAAGYPSVETLETRDSLQDYLDIPTGERKPLTIITVKDLCFCLEHRSVEIKGLEIELTEKEFDILALLIMNQRQVFTYEMIMDAIWQNDYSFYSRNTLSTHVSNLRRKLKIAPDIPAHIVSVRGIGYKFEA